MKFLEELGKRILFLDGGMGTLLQEQGLKSGELPETWNLSHPEILVNIHKSYLEAGADIILTNTFGANSFKFQDNLDAIIEAGIYNAKRARSESGKEAYIALDIGSTGKLIRPLGSLGFEEAVDIFSEIIRIGVKAGVDLILIETMSDLYELKAAILAAKENSNLPIITTVIFDEYKKMLTGSSPAGMIAMTEGLRVDCLGVNCGLGPKQMFSVMDELVEYSSTPLAVSPNAGLPRTENGKTIFDVGPDEFAEDMEIMIGKGAWIVGGCCGTRPEHIRALKKRCKDIKPVAFQNKEISIVSTYSQTVELGKKPIMIGERINPTGKSKFKQALRDGNIDYILEEGVRQVESGAHILDVNVGLPEINETEMMKKTIYELQSIIGTPLQIDTTDIETLEAAMRMYNGKAMVNSVNGKQEVMDQVFPLIKKYGGLVVGLTLDENGIPETSQGRIEIANKIYREASKYGIHSKDIIIDALTMTMSTDDESANITLDTVKFLNNNKKRTVLGISNISFGLPQRELLTSAFFTLAMEAGLSAGIVNPNAKMIKQAYDTYLLLKGMDRQCKNYIDIYGNIQTSIIKDVNKKMNLEECIIKGFKEQSYKETKEMLKMNQPMDIINKQLVPALDYVGKGFEEGTMFLPQLLMSAEAAKSGFEAIREYMSDTGETSNKKATVVIATVKGDIHDIGKNIVKVLLENYSYQVIDLGKDVEPEGILENVIKFKAELVGLSALMTTTVVYMEKTIRLLKEQAPWCKIMVGGAVLTQEYADMIGADFYGKDAMQSVHYAEKLFNKKI